MRSRSWAKAVCTGPRASTRHRHSSARHRILRMVSSPLSCRSWQMMLHFGAFRPDGGGMGSPSQIPRQSSVSRFPRPGPSSQLWQGTTVPSGATAMLHRHAPQLGIRCRPMSRRASSGSQPGLVKSSSMPRLVGRFRRPARGCPSAPPGSARVARLLLPGGGAGGDKPRAGDVPHPQAVRRTAGSRHSPGSGCKGGCSPTR